jgi:hypothetical protein
MHRIDRIESGIVPILFILSIDVGGRPCRPHNIVERRYADRRAEDGARSRYQTWMHRIDRIESGIVPILFILSIDR